MVDPKEGAVLEDQDIIAEEQLQEQDNEQQEANPPAKDGWEADALELGWNPSGRLGAREFMRDLGRKAKTYERVGKQSRQELREIRETQRQIMDALEKVSQASMSPKIDSLRSQIAQAYRDGDDETAERLQDQLIELRSHNPRPKQTVEKRTEPYRSDIDPIIDKRTVARFAEKNPAIFEDDEASDLFSERVQHYARMGMDTQKALIHAKTDVRTDMPELFRKQPAEKEIENRTTIPPVGSGGRGSTGNQAKYSFSKLPPDARKSADEYVESCLADGMKRSDAERSYLEEYVNKNGEFLR